MALTMCACTRCPVPLPLRLLAGLYFYVMCPTPAEPCFFLTKPGFIKAIMCRIATTIVQLGNLRAQRTQGNAALVFGSILVAASPVTKNRVREDRQIK